MEHKKLAQQHELTHIPPRPRHRDANPFPDIARVPAAAYQLRTGYQPCDRVDHLKVLPVYGP
jgi:hypothetical protein